MMSSSLAAAAAAVILTVLVLNPSQREPGRPVEFTVAPEGVTASARVQDWGWGLQVHLEIAGLTDDEPLAVCWSSLTGASLGGQFHDQGWRLTMTMGASATTTDVVALGVSNAAGETVLRTTRQHEVGMHGRLATPLKR